MDRTSRQVIETTAAWRRRLKGRALPNMEPAVICRLGTEYDQEVRPSWAS